MKPRDRVLVKGLDGNKYPGTIVSISEYREPSMQVCVDMDHIPEDYVFVPHSAVEYLPEEDAL